MKNKEIELTETGRYRDGGSISYRDQDGNEYWRDNEIGTKTKGMLYCGNINRNGRSNPYNGSYFDTKTLAKGFQQINNEQ